MAADGAMRWFITGISTGFGRELARTLVASGNTVLGTVRAPHLVAELAAEGIDAILMDVTDQAAVDAGVQAMVERHGGVDVVVNNAGFGLVGAIEALSLDEIRSVMETNFFGALRVTRAFLPLMRARGGTLVMISSMAGQIGLAGAGAYCASKFALEGLSDALGEELAPFGVKVMIVEPGAFRTDCSGRSARAHAASVEAYAGTQAGEVKTLIAAYHGHEPGDPVKAAEAIVAAVRSGQPPRRLALGSDAVDGILRKLDAVRGDIDTWREASLATAFA